MSCERFRRRLSRAQVHLQDLKWMPCWLDQYAQRLGAQDAERLPITDASVLRFLRWLRDGGTPA